MCSAREVEIGAVATRQTLADLLDGDRSAVGGHAHVNREAVEAPDPQVVDLPSGDLVEQSRIDTGPDHRRGSQRVLALLMLDLGVRRALGQIPLPDALELDRLFPRSNCGVESRPSSSDHDERAFRAAGWVSGSPGR
jgi:hypothetical protein